ncbi:arylsulfatase [Winogradskyella sp.]|uniref:arylsulfatase n=1 Tax=Winogradskyella sp. TaxID=1883156 RepID=UPI003BAD469A
MTKRLVITIFVVCGLVISCKDTPKPIIEQAGASKPPNIILILADDMGFSDLGCYGSSIDTPVLDSLADTGIRFTQFYNTSKCFPSRAALLTGLYAHQVGVGRSWRHSWKNSTTIAKALKAKGYTTMMSGKHHGVDVPTDSIIGFDRYYGLLSGAANHFNPGNQRIGEIAPARKKVRPWYIDGKRYEPYTPRDTSFYSTIAFTNAALKWLEKDFATFKEEGSLSKPDPFFLYLSYTAPHDPLMALPEDIEKYRGKYRHGYEVERQRRFVKQKALGIIPEDFKMAAPTYQDWDSLTDQEKDDEDLKMAIYSAMVDRMDTEIGRVMNLLRTQNRLENTIVLFVSDNGSSAETVNVQGDGQVGSMGNWTMLGHSWANVNNTPYRLYKNYSYEGGIKTPAIVSWSKMKENNQINDKLYAHFIDVFPTLLSLAGYDYETPDGVLEAEGISLVETVDENQESGITLIDIPQGRPLFFQWKEGAAVREGDWKLVREGEAWELYNIGTDPGETKNIIAQEPEKASALQKQFKAWQERVGVIKK